MKKQVFANMNVTIKSYVIGGGGYVYFLMARVGGNKFVDVQKALRCNCPFTIVHKLTSTSATHLTHCSVYMNDKV